MPAGCRLLPANDPEVAKDFKKVKKGQRLSPVLLVRGGLDHDRLLTVADGYHRICLSYHEPAAAAGRRSGTGCSHPRFAVSATPARTSRTRS